MRGIGYRTWLGLELPLLFAVSLFAQAQSASSTENPANRPADQQHERRSDRDITKIIKDAITEDSSLSGEARKIKVEAQDGRVTLKGSVESAEEKQAIEAKAAAIAGAESVTSELAIKPQS